MPATRAPWARAVSTTTLPSAPRAPVTTTTFPSMMGLRTPLKQEHTLSSEEIHLQCRAFSRPDAGSTGDSHIRWAFQMIDNFALADLPDDIIGFKYPFPRLAQALRTQSPLRIVAMGSSSTAGRED